MRTVCRTVEKVSSTSFRTVEKTSSTSLQSLKHSLRRRRNYASVRFELERLVSDAFSTVLLIRIKKVSLTLLQSNLFRRRRNYASVRFVRLVSNTFSTVRCILLALSLSACTPKDSLFQGQTELPSQTPTTTLVPQTNSQGLLLNCNEFEETSVALSGRIKIYEDPLNGYQDDRVSVRLDSLPTNWDTNSNLQIRFYRWRTSPSGEVSQDSNPLDFYIRDPNTAQNISGSDSSLSHTDFFSLLGRNDARTLLQLNLIVMVGTPDEGYHVIRPVLYNVQLDETVGYTDALIPAFIADPNLYAQTHHDFINSIHPFWNKKDEGWSENNYIAFGKEFCF